MSHWQAGGVKPRTYRAPLARAETLLDLCATRFDARLYAQATGRSTRVDERFGHFCGNFALRAQAEENFHFFSLLLRCQARSRQRFPDWNSMTASCAFLYLHLYTRPTPSNWIAKDYDRKWNRLSLEEKEETASLLRQWFFECRY